MKFGSTAVNINLLTIFTAILSVMGFWNTSMFSWTNVMIIIVSFYIFNTLGIWMTMHRYYSHKSFEFKNILLKWTFTILATLTGRGSPLGWVYLHRKHHAYSDTNKDPHSPKYLGYKLFGFSHYKKQEEEKMQLFLIKDLMTKEQLFIHKWYILIMLAFIILFALINVELFYFVWVVPAFLIQVSQYNFNYFGHMFGYRNFDTKDDSRNNIWLFPILLGEAWHNNHHANPKNTSTTVRQFEIDPLQWFIKLIKK
jgi:stearoyl-CoA desaturase (delta-9 desaturase)